ncbi:MAG: Tat pathway signal protein [Halobacteriales archaeon]
MTDRTRMPRRAFVKGAVAAGGAAALSACMAAETPSDEERLDLPTRPNELSALPERQHAWNDHLPTDEHGNVVEPRHRVVLLLDYGGEGPPDAGDRETVERAFRSLERAYPRAGDGLLFTVSYSPYYFDRFDADLPVDLPKPAALASFEDPEFDDPEALVHLASNYGSVVLGAEAALLGERETLNGVDVAADLTGVFERRERRTGFVGEGMPAERDDVEGVPEGAVPEDAPMYMGFESGFEKTQATEGAVTIPEGPFAGGTTQHLSAIDLHLDQWYEQDSRYHRVATMFCPVHAEENLVEGAGHNLGDSARMDAEGCPAHADEHANEYGTVGHSQKAARAREDGQPQLIRRDFDSTDGGQASLHFLSLQESIADFVRTREAMNGADLDSPAVGQRTNNGILQYMTVTRRGNYLVPPRSKRALPAPGR